jgi:hypothetical protein
VAPGWLLWSRVVAPGGHERVWSALVEVGVFAAPPWALQPTWQAEP